MIQDQELSDVFKVESAEQLQALDDGLMRLEGAPQDGALIEEVFRAAHSLKGAARMLDLPSLEAVAHRFEDLLGTAKRGELALTLELLERLFRGVAVLRQLVDEAISGDPAGVDVPKILKDLDGNPATPPEPAGLAAEPEAMDAAQTRAALPPGDARAGAAFKIGTIRVDPHRLDTLMNLAGELTVTKLRIARRLPEIEKILSLWEEWTRDAFAHRFSLADLERLLGNGAMKRMSNYWHREEERLEHLGGMINQIRHSIYEDNTRLDFVAGDLDDNIRTMRLLSFATIFNLFPRMVRDLGREQGKEVQLVIEGGETTADKRIMEEIKDPLMHLIRNAVDHGLESPEERCRRGKPSQGTIRLRAFQTATNVVIEISDDGRGLDLEAIKHQALKRKLYREEELGTMTASQLQMLIFAPGFSTSPVVTDLSGRGVGLDVVLTNVERLKGSVQVDSAPGEGCTFRALLPITLVTTRVLLAQEHSRTYALPIEFVQTTRLVMRREIFHLEGRETIVQDGQPMSVARLADLLELTLDKLPGPGKGNGKSADGWLACIVLGLGQDRLGLLVEMLLDEQEVVLKPFGAMLKRVRNVSGATILGTGEICMVLNPQDLMKSVWKRGLAATAPLAAPEDERRLTLLVVEDSITTRTQMKRILENAGYEVVTAVDGMDALGKLGARPFDAVVSDIQMPNLDGLGLTARIRQDRNYKEMPVILVTSLANEEDKRRGLEAGADAYITKSGFDQQTLLDTLRRLV